MLLASGTDMSASDMCGRSPEDLATSKSHVRIVAMLAEQRRAKYVAFGQNLALTVFHVPYSLDSGARPTFVECTCTFFFISLESI